MCNDNNVITIKMPVKKEYSQVLRLAAAGAFNLAGYDLDIIEDIKVVVSEILNCLLQTDTTMFEVAFIMEENFTNVEFKTCDHKDVLRGANDMTLPILQALVTKVSICENGKLVISLEK